MPSLEIVLGLATLKSIPVMMQIVRRALTLDVNRYFESNMHKDCKVFLNTIPTNDQLLRLIEEFRAAI